MATKKTTKKAAPKKKAVAKKPAKKAVPKKKTVAKKPAKKAPAKKKVVTKKTVAKKPAKKAPAKKKVVAKKPVKKVAAKKPVKKAEPKKKTVAKKEAPKKVKLVKEKKKAEPKVKAVKEKKPQKETGKKTEKQPKVKAEKPVKIKAEKEPKAKKEKATPVPEMRMASKPSNPKPSRGSDKKSPFYKEADIKALASINPAFKLHNARPTVMTTHVQKEKDTRTRYSDAELQEFKEIILSKLDEAKKDLEMLRGSLSHTDDHGTDDTSPTFKMMEDGSETLSREETAQLAGRQEKFILNLENALMRIQNKTYGICRVTGNLISKERLRLVPHTTLSIDAKKMQD